MPSPAPGAPFRQYEAPFFKPLLFTSIYRESSATVDAFALQAFEGRVNPRGNAQVFLVLNEPAFIECQEDLKRRSEEQTFIECELRVDLKMGNLSAGGMEAIHGLATTLPAVAYPSSVRQFSIEYEDVPGVRYAAHLSCVLGEALETVEGGQDKGKVKI